MEYSSIDEDLIVQRTPNKVITRPYITSTLICLLGGLIGGGPIGIILISLFKMGTSLSVITEVISLLIGFTTTKYIQSLVIRNSDSNQKHINNLNISNQNLQIMKTTISQNDTETTLTLLINLINEDHSFSCWYNNIIGNYYRNKTDNLKNNISEISNSLLIMLVDITGVFTRANNNITLDSEQIVLNYCISESILMMSLYDELNNISRKLNKKKDTLFKNNKQKINEDIMINSEIINLLNTLPYKHTSTQKVKLLIKVCELINNDGALGCDNLLISFVNHLAKSDIKYPFSEIEIIEALLPKGLIGKESYAIATFLASSHYITSL